MGSATGKLRKEVLCCCGLSLGIQVPEPQLRSAGHASKAACRSRLEKIQLQELVYKKEKDLCLDAHAVFCAFIQSDSGD